MTSAGFTVQYAIRLPDGKLATNPMNGGKPFIWDDLPTAEQVLKNLRDSADSIGIPGWSGSIEHRYCSSFVPMTDSAERLVAELDDWRKQQTGEQK